MSGGTSTLVWQERSANLRTRSRDPHPPLSSSKQISAEMQGSHQSRFMALPAELRCHIYTFLPELVYKPVFPALSWSPVGMCCWPVYRMPTSVLQVSKLVQEEIRDAIVQTVLQQLNDWHPPTIVLGPYFRQKPAFSQMPFLFWKVLSGALGAPHEKILGKSRAEFIRYHLADWVVWYLTHSTYSVNLPPMDFSTPEKPVAALYLILLPFVEQTLTRMDNHRVPEVNLRFLIRGSSHVGNRSADTQMQRCLYQYSVLLERDEARYKDHHDSDVSITFVIPDNPEKTYTDKTFTDRLLVHVRRKGLRFIVEQPCAEDQRLFDESCNFDQPQNHDGNS